MIDKNGINLTQWRPIDKSELLQERDRVFQEYGFVEVDSTFYGKNPPDSYDYYRPIPFVSEYGAAPAPLPPARFSYRDWLIGQIASGMVARPDLYLFTKTAIEIINFADTIILNKDKK